MISDDKTKGDLNKYSDLYITSLFPLHISDSFANV